MFAVFVAPAIGPEMISTKKKGIQNNRPDRLFFSPHGSAPVFHQPDDCQNHADNQAGPSRKAGQYQDSVKVRKKFFYSSTGPEDKISQSGTTNCHGTFCVHIRTPGNTNGFIYAPGQKEQGQTEYNERN